MEKEYTKKLASEWTTEEKCAKFDKVHEMMGLLFDFVVKYGELTREDNSILLAELMDVIGEGANDYLDDVVRELYKKDIEALSLTSGETCDCQCEECRPLTEKKEGEEDPNSN